MPGVRIRPTIHQSNSSFEHYINLEGIVWFNLFLVHFFSNQFKFLNCFLNELSRFFFFLVGGGVLGGGRGVVRKQGLVLLPSTHLPLPDLLQYLHPTPPFRHKSGRLALNTASPRYLKWVHPTLPSQIWALSLKYCFSVLFEMGAL